jgi:hypothetical protein
MIESAYSLAIGWGLAPSEFWKLHPTEFWWFAKAKNPEAFQESMFDQLLRLYEDGF